MSFCKKIFAEEGSLAKKLPGYKMRWQQVKMAVAVEKTVADGGVLLAEAGTGTGKTLAYLAPAVLSDATVIISTGTKNLQEQVFFKDLELLKGALGIKVNAVYLKGQENYACLRRMKRFFISPKVLTYPPEVVAHVQKWADKTATGDKMEISQMKDDDALWREINSTKDTRIGPKCPFSADCFVNRARNKAQDAQIVVVNHHLYFADVATRMSGGSVLPDHDAVVFDEAHMVEDIATDFFSVTISSGRVFRLLDDTVSTLTRPDDENPRKLKRKINLINIAKKTAYKFFTLFENVAGKRKVEKEELDGEKMEAYLLLDNHLDGVYAAIKQVENKSEVLENCIDKMGSLRTDFNVLMEQGLSGYVHWVEKKKRTVILGASPIDVSKLMKENLFFKVPAVVMTSATISTAGDFNFFKSRLGIDFEANELSLPSPFDFENQTLFYIPKHLVDPRHADFADQAFYEIDKLINLSGGGALILCTSIRNMKKLYESLSGKTPGPLYVQGQEPKSILLDKMKNDHSSVLCATASFWQGVDLPGDALRMLIMDKLPFASPAEPLVSERMKFLEKKGTNPFFAYQVPDAVLALKQGFGRLVRTVSDKGVVAVLDSRLVTKSYGKMFISSLPDSPLLTEFKDVKDRWKKMGI